MVVWMFTDWVRTGKVSMVGAAHRRARRPRRGDARAPATCPPGRRSSSPSPPAGSATARSLPQEARLGRLARRVGRARRRRPVRHAHASAGSPTPPSTAPTASWTATPSSSACSWPAWHRPHLHVRRQLGHPQGHRRGRQLSVARRCSSRGLDEELHGERAYDLTRAAAVAPPGAAARSAGKTKLREGPSRQGPPSTPSPASDWPYIARLDGELPLADIARRFGGFDFVADRSATNPPPRRRRIAVARPHATWPSEMRPIVARTQRARRIGQDRVQLGAGRQRRTDSRGDLKEVEPGHRPPQRSRAGRTASSTTRRPPGASSSRSGRSTAAGSAK